MNEINKNCLKFLEITCECFGVNENNNDKIYKDEDIKYSVILILQKYYPMYEEILEKLLIKKEETSFYYDRAMEKLILDREFREKYFFIKDKMERYL